MTIVYEKIINEIEVLLQFYMSNQRLMSNTSQPMNLHNVLEAMISLRRSRDIAIVTNIIIKVSSLYNCIHNLYYYHI